MPGGKLPDPKRTYAPLRPGKTPKGKGKKAWVKPTLTNCGSFEIITGATPCAATITADIVSGVI